MNYMRETGTSHRKTAAIFNIPSPSTVLKWEKAFKENGIDALKSKKRGRPIYTFHSYIDNTIH